MIVFGYREIEDGKGIYDCWANFQPAWTLQLYVSWIAIAIYFVPLFMLVSAYGVICYAVWRSMSCRESSFKRPSKSFKNGFSLNGVERGTLLDRPGANGMSSAPRVHARGMPKAKLKTVKLTLAVVLSYLLCWGPFFVCQLWAAWDIHAPFTG